VDRRQPLPPAVVMSPVLDALISALYRRGGGDGRSRRRQIQQDPEPGEGVGRHDLTAARAVAMLAAAQPSPAWGLAVAADGLGRCCAGRHCLALCHRFRALAAKRGEQSGPALDTQRQSGMFNDPRSKARLACHHVPVPAARCRRRTLRATVR
jgi:hypothetical protein